MVHVQQFGNKKWSKCAEYLAGRSGKQCRERWHNHLDPDINKNPWSDAEHAIFVENHTKLGNQWALIAQFLPGRTDNAVKNRWNNMRAKATGERSSGKKRKLADALLQHQPDPHVMDPIQTSVAGGSQPRRGELMRKPGKYSELD